MIPNIGPRGQRSRFLTGLVGVAVALFGLSVLVVADAPRLSRAVLVLPLWIAGLGFFQARAKT